MGAFTVTVEELPGREFNDELTARGCTHESIDHVGQMHPITVWVGSPEPPHTGDVVSDTNAREFRCDCGDIGDAESELHPRDWSVARRKKLKNGPGLSDLTVGRVRSAWLVVVEQGDANCPVERCGLIDIGYKEGEFQQRVYRHAGSVAGASDNSRMAERRNYCNRIKA